MSALSEMLRVLRVGGRGLVYAWAKDQHGKGAPSAYIDRRKDDDAANAEVKLAFHLIPCI